MSTNHATHEGHDTWPLISKPGTVWCRTCQVHFTAAPDNSAEAVEARRAMFAGFGWSVAR